MRIVPDFCRMLTIRKADVPHYLRKSDFYFSLIEDEEDISVPADFFKFNDTVADDADLRFLLSALRFWVTEQIPEGLLFFVLTDTGGSLNRVFSEFSKELTYLPLLLILGMTGESLRLSLAAGQGNTQVLRYLLSHGYPANVISTQVASRNGHLECLQLLHEAGVELLDAAICTSAAQNGHLRCLVYAHEHGCPFAADIAAKAAGAGHLGCLQYVHTHDCAWMPIVALHAGASGSLDCLKYVLDTFAADADCFSLVPGRLS